MRLGPPLFGHAHHLDALLAADLPDVAAVGVGHVHEERHHPVVVGLGDRVLLVVVTPGAVDGHAQEHLAGGRDQAVEHVVAGLEPVGGLVVEQPQPVEPGRGLGLD